MDYNAMNGFDYMTGWGMGFGGFMMVFWLVALLALVYFVARAGANNGNGNNHNANN